ncbi:diaminopimelate decarboxylase [Deinococcus yavapaiensis]|uniref:Diaminopimelate decarboxylase n=1 Tax=Deinococcus yavapaiensis KR-236 TaxID=694435 RepID=A0A318STC1_9DEIO|nr:diaminopimelate decarboxylase [Deinococcus yavapaiensis]PYE56486.1 diaminopimelate decarboxylase [Deinococcus yavapaiensis KR-236]
MLSPALLQDAAERFGTPLYVYDAAEIDGALGRVRAAFGDARVFYAMKANSNFTILERLRARGVGFEAVSPGELARVRHLGCAGSEVIVNGPAKTREEYELGQAMGATFVLDRLSEVALVAPGTAVLLRVNPALDVSTHDHLATGAAKSKFGVRLEDVERGVKLAREAGLVVRGLHVHIGSAIREAADFGMAFEKLAKLDVGTIDVLDVGGGWGLDADLSGIASKARQARDALGASELWVEPGRYLVARSGALLTRVVGLKQTGRSFVIVDAGMTELMRPMLYGASHPLLALYAGGTEGVFDLAGPACESGDLLASNVTLPTPSVGDAVAVLEAGAYGAAMSSTYLSRSRPAEVMYDAGAWQVIRRRERPEDVWRAELAEAPTLA